MDNGSSGDVPTEAYRGNPHTDVCTFDWFMDLLGICLNLLVHVQFFLLQMCSMSHIEDRAGLHF